MQKRLRRPGRAKPDRTGAGLSNNKKVDLLRPRPRGKRRRDEPPKAKRYRECEGPGWTAQLYVNGIAKTRRAKTYTEAEDKKRAMIRERDAGKGTLADPRYTLHEARDDFLANGFPKHIAPATIESVRYNTQLADRQLGGTRLTELTPRAILAFLDETAEEHGRTWPAMVRKLLRRIIEDARRNGKFTGTNPVNELPWTPQGKLPPLGGKAIPEAQAKRLFAEACQDDSLIGPYTALSLEVGLRPLEARAVRWSSLNLEGPDPEIWVRDWLKTDGSERRERISTPVAEALIRHRKRQDEDRRRAGDRWEDNDLAFAHPKPARCWIAAGCGNASGR